MGNKRNRNKSAKSGRHNEAMTIRHRLEQKLVRLDRNNEPIPPGKRKALTKAMIDSGAMKPPESFYQPEPEIPKNVVPISKAPPTDTTPEASPRRTEYAAEIREQVNSEKVLYASWSRSAKAGVEDDILLHDGSKLFVSKSERQTWQLRFASEMYESGKHRKEEDDEPVRQDIDASVATKPALSLVHNSGIKRNPVSKPVRATQHDPTVISALNARNRKSKAPANTGLTPSGLPISNFMENSGVPTKPQSTVVYTTPAANDDNKKQRSASEWSAEHLLFKMIETTSQDAWPRQVMDYLYQDGDEWHVHTGMVRKAIAAGDDRVILKAVAIALLESQGETSNGLRNKYVNAKREAIAAKKEVTQLEYAYAQISGDISSAEQIKKEVKHDWTPMGARQSVREMEKEKYGSAYAKPPEDVDRALSEFKLFKNLYERDNELRAYCRYMYGSVEYAQTMQEHADYLCAERQRAYDDRVRMLRLKRFFRQIPAMLKIQTDRAMARRIKSTMTGELQALKSFRRRAAKRNHQSSIYYSDLNIQICSVSEQTTVEMSNAGIKPSVMINGRVVGASCSFMIVKRKPYQLVAPKPKPTARSINKELHVQHWRNSNPDLIKEVGWWLLKYEPTEPTCMVDYRPCKGTLPTYDTSMGECRVRQHVIDWWHKSADKCEDDYLATTVRGKVVRAATETSRKVWSILQTPIDPTSRKKMRDKEEAKLMRKTNREQHRAYAAERNTKAEAKLEEQREIRRRIRQAQRIAH